MTRVPDRHRRTVIVATCGASVAAVAVGIAVLGAPFGSSDISTGPAHRLARATTSMVGTTTSAPATSTTTTLDPGTLPQTNQFPPTDSPQFTSEMQALWAGIVSGSPDPAFPSFFPRSAYVQLKTGVADPAADWRNRLVADFALDLQAAHSLLGPDASSASFKEVTVPEQYGHWVPPGVCANGIGYYEVANSRLVYSLAGQTRSIGIASMISWRGAWYVVHLGAIVRPSASGMVDDPQSGPGNSLPSHTC